MNLNKFFFSFPLSVLETLVVFSFGGIGADTLRNKRKVKAGRVDDMVYVLGQLALLHSDNPGDLH